MWIFCIGMTLAFTRSINGPDDDQSEGLDEATNLDRIEDSDQTAISTNIFGNHTE
jgi:hypothetical protein